MPLSKDDYFKCKMVKLLTFSYLQGDELYHKIALLDRATRQSLPEAGLLDQGI